MASLSGQCSVMKEISKTEEAIQDCYKRVQKLENILNNKQDNAQDDVRKELEEVRKLLATNEEQLTNLHKHNRKSFIFAAGLCFIGFFVYMMYILISGYEV